MKKSVLDLNACKIRCLPTKIHSAATLIESNKLKTNISHVNIELQIAASVLDRSVEIPKNLGIKQALFCLDMIADRSWRQ